MTTPALQFSERCSSGFAWVVIGFLCVGLGVMHANAATLALGITLIGVPAIVYLLLRASMQGLRVRRKAPTTAFEEEPVGVELCLDNNGRWPAFYPQVSEIFPPEIHTQKDLLYSGRVIPGEEVRHTYKGHCLLPRGIYELGRPCIRLQDPWGWFERRKTSLLDEVIQIYPRIVTTDTRDAMGRALEQLEHWLSDHRAGESTNFLGVREYRAGDSPRRIHWGVSAHRSAPVVRTYERPTTGQLGLVLDLTRAALVGLGRNSSLELAIKLAAALSARAVNEGQRVQLVAGSLETSGWGSGNTHLTQILDILSRIRVQGEDLTLPELLEELRTHDRRQLATWVVMASPYLFEGVEFDSAPLTQQLRQLRAQGQRLWVVVFDESTFPQLRGYRTPKQLARGQEYAQFLRGEGFDVCVLPCGADLEAGLHGVGY